jgi:hypothetical protein
LASAIAEHSAETFLLKLLAVRQVFHQYRQKLFSRLGMAVEIMIDLGSPVFGEYG